MEKSAVYDEDLHASLLRFDFVITTGSRILSLITTFLIKYMGKLTFSEKTIFSRFLSEIEERSLGQLCRVDQALS